MPIALNAVGRETRVSGVTFARRFQPSRFTMSVRFNSNRGHPKLESSVKGAIVAEQKKKLETFNHPLEVIEELDGCQKNTSVQFFHIAFVFCFLHNPKNHKTTTTK